MQQSMYVRRRFGVVLAAAALLLTGWSTTAATVSAAPSSSADRLSGDDRYATAVAVAELAGGGSLTGLTDLVIASGQTFPDALVAAGLAGHLDTCTGADDTDCDRSAILLTDRDALPASTADAIRESGVPASRITVVGGAAAVSAEVHAAIARAAGWNGSGTNPVGRAAGTNRYETAAATVQHTIARAAMPGATPLAESYRTVVIASGESFPDALSAGAFAFRFGHLVLLTRKDSVPNEITAAIRSLNARCAVVVGGTAAVSDATVDQIETALVDGGASCPAERLADSDRYGTSAATASRTREIAGGLQGDDRDGVLIASGTSFADALASTVLSKNNVTLLTEPTRLPPATQAWLTENQSQVTGVTVIGGNDAVPPAVVDIVAEAVGGSAPSTSQPLPPPPSPTVPPLPALEFSYANTSFSTSVTASVITPTVTGGASTPVFSVTGTLPDGVEFDATTGAFTGPSAWSLSATQVVTGEKHACALTSSGGVKCWGSNTMGQLGNGSVQHGDVTGLTTGVVQIAAGTSHTCALLDTGGVKCWGYNDGGRLGDGTTSNRYTPVDVLSSAGVPLGGATQIVAGHEHTCALMAAGGVKCWGNGGWHRLGDGTGNQKSYPVDVRVAINGATLSGITQVSAGSLHTCALTATGGVKCWGANNVLQLGGGIVDNYKEVPVDVVVAVGGATLSGVTQISAGWAHSCARLSSGGVWCWGANDSGRLGDGTTTSRAVATEVTVSAGVPLNGVESVSAGTAHTCAVLATGGVVCWGKNDQGQLGDGSTTISLSPVAVTTSAGTPLAGVTQMESSDASNCARSGDGSLRCWGSNGDGRLGSTVPSPSTSAEIVTGFVGLGGWPASVTVTATDSRESVSVPITLSLL